MSDVWVRLDEAQRGSLPARCARSGARCMTRYPRQARDLDPRVEWVTWTGLWPRRPDVPAETIVLPLLPSRRRLDVGLRRARDVSAALLPPTVLLAVLADGTLGRIAVAAAIGLIGLHLVSAAVGLLLTVRLRRDITGQWVLLSGVHRDFAAAAEAVTTRPTTTPLLAAEVEDDGVEGTGSEDRADGPTGEAA